MKKITISGSSSLQDDIKKWVKYWTDAGYQVIDYPEAIDKNNLVKEYPKLHKDFYSHINQSNTLFIMNEDKKDIKGYIGAATFAEIAFAVTQNLIFDKKIDIKLIKMPAPEVQCYDEIKLWIEIGWINISPEPNNRL